MPRHYPPGNQDKTYVLWSVVGTLQLMYADEVARPIAVNVGTSAPDCGPPTGSNSAPSLTL